MESTLTQLTDLLALPSTRRKTISGTADIEPALREGLPSLALHHVHQALSMTVADFSPLLGVSPRSFYEMLKRKKVDMTVSDRLFRVAQVIAIASSLFKSRPKAIEWMHTPLQALAGASPLEKLGTEIGAQRVHEVLSAIEHGVYA